MNTEQPLKGMLVLDFCQYLAGPSAAMRLADLGARAIKVERPGTGDGSRRLALEGLWSDGDAVNFHAINRNKESVTFNTKDSNDLAKVRRLVAQADVLIEAFRPGVMDKMGLGYEDVKVLNPRIVYGSVSGYGTVGPWVRKPGQDLLVQSLSGLAWLNGDAGQPPMPFALSLADSYTGVHLVEGILSCLVRREATGEGGHVEVSLLSSILDLQFEVITTYLNDGHRPPHRSAFHNAHAYLAAPYGIYRTADGYIALAMGAVPRIGDLIGSTQVASYKDPGEWFTKRDEIKREIATVLERNSTAHWLSILEPAGVWCSDVYTWERLMASDAFKALDFLQNVAREGDQELLTTRCPIDFIGEHRPVSKPSPRLGADTERVTVEFGLDADAPDTDMPESMMADGGSDAIESVKPLSGVRVLDLGQFLSAPSATLRLADLGADVLKVERPGGGDICRSLYISDCVIDGDSSLFHAINRNKRSVAIDLKDPESRPAIERLIRESDVVVVNYRPGVAARLGVDYETVKALNPHVVYGEITGYGTDGPWIGKPGQDLLAQALSGICWLNGNADQPPTPMGLSVGDLFAGQLLVQGVTAGLLRAKRTGASAHVHVSLLEALLDMQFEVFTTYLNDGHQPPRRSEINNANAYISAPYGIYATADGYLALAMIPIPALGSLIGCDALLAYEDPDSWHERRDEIKRIIAGHLAGETTEHWLSILEPADVWCADVYTWDRLMSTEAFRTLDMIQEVTRRGSDSTGADDSSGVTIRTTCCPILIDGERYKSGPAAPTVGQDNDAYL